MTKIVLKRVYEDYSEDDGFRVLLDRLWPRGIKKADAHLDLWLKEIAPSTELRKWFNHEDDKWEEFSKQYLEEVARNQKVVEQLKEVIKKNKKVTFLFGAKNEKHNQAVVLKKLLES